MCDFHLVSLRPEWTGSVVPSKFFGAIASGRGVIFSGREESAIARWTRQYDLGWVLTSGNLEEISGELRRISQQPEGLDALHSRCLQVNRDVFSKEQQIEKNAALCSLLHSQGSS